MLNLTRLQNMFGTRELFCIIVAVLCLDDYSRVMCDLQIMATSDDMETNNKRLQSLSADLSCASRIIVLLIRLWLNLCPADVAALEASLSSVVNDATKQVNCVTVPQCRALRFTDAK